MSAQEASKIQQLEREAQNTLDVSNEASAKAAQGIHQMIVNADAEIEFTSQMVQPQIKVASQREEELADVSPTAETRREKQDGGRRT